MDWMDARELARVSTRDKEKSKQMSMMMIRMCYSKRYELKLRRNRRQQYQQTKRERQLSIYFNLLIHQKCLSFRKNGIILLNRQVKIFLNHDKENIRSFRIDWSKINVSGIRAYFSWLISHISTFNVRDVGRFLFNRQKTR